VRDIVRIAHRARLLRIAGATASLAMLVLLCIAGAAVLDAGVRFPALLRAALLAVTAFLVAVDLRKFVLPALRFRPDPVEIALRIERARPELRGRLASAVDFELSGMSRGSPLALRAVQDAEERSGGTDFGRILRWRPTVARVAGAALCAGAAAAVTVAKPEWTSIALRRVLLPWSDVAWPARTAVEGLVVDGTVAASGRPFALRARLTQGEAERERVRAEYRLVRGEAAGEWIEVGLSRQPSGEFERIVDAEGDRLEVRFLTSDAATEVAGVRLVEPPKVREASVAITPPEYAKDAVAARSERLGDLGGTRGILRDPVLEGSSVRYEVVLSRALPLDPAKPPMRAVAGGDVAAGVAIEADPADASRWTIRCEAMKPLRIGLMLVDADGIAADDEVVLAFDTVPDRAPSAAIAEPTQDESVVADARITMRGEARDDIGLVKAGIEIATRIGKDGPEGMVLEEPAPVAGAATEAEVERVLDLAKLALSAGDSVVLRGFAEDAVPAHGRVRSASRTLRIVGEDEFERQIRGALAGVRRDAMRIDERQGKARDALEKDAAQRGLAEMQGAVTEGAARMREAVEQAQARLGRNGRDEGVLAELAEQARDLASAAEARSAEASEAVERAQGAQDPEKRAEDAKVAAERQEAVRAELEDLVQLLDRDQDSWLARRRLDALAGKIRQSARETDQAAQRSRGESREELSAEGRAEIDALADRQRQASEEAEQVVEELKERAQELKEADPQQSRALEEAAKLAEEGRVREEMEQAAEDAGENRLAQSKQAQDRAAAALERATEALGEDRKVRAKELARELESLVDAIKRLIAGAEATQAEVAEIGGDAAGDADRERAALGAGKLSQNTRGVAADARATGREAARAARTLDAAAGSLAKVAGNLRADPFDRDDTSLAMDAALKSLNDALVEAEEAADRAEQRAEAEKREELLAKYRDFLERQAAVRASVAKIVPADGQALGRRELIESRRLGTVQEELRKAIADLRATDEDVGSSDALVEMHDAIESALADAKEQLTAGKPAGAMPGEDEAVAALSAIVAALDESAGAGEDDDPFGEQQAGAGGDQEGGGSESGGTVPPSAEVKLLRAMQDSLAKRTRAFDERSAAMDAVARAQQVAELAARQQRIVELGQKLAEKIAPRGNAPALRPEGGGSGPNPSPNPPDSGGAQP